MRHAEDHLLDAEAPGLLDQRLEQRHERLGAFEREALRRRVAELQELLETLGGNEAVEDGATLGSVEVGAVELGLHLLLEPAALLRVLDVQVLDAERAAVGRLEPGDQLAQRRPGLAAAEVAGVDDPIEVGLAEAELRRLEERMARWRLGERIQPRHEVTELAVGVHEVDGAEDGRRRGTHDRPAAVGPEVEPGEEGRPARVDRAGVGEPAAVLLVDVVGVRERDTCQRTGHVVSSSAWRLASPAIPLERRVRYRVARFTPINLRPVKEGS